ncbi:MAG: CopG family transcriptional regulator [Rickettsiales bacterium]|nr:MAG: CopG family transcriptional regulator [Rickettsiales bacterium]
MAANKILTVKLEAETKSKLQHLGKVKSRSTHWLMKKAIDDYVEKEEKKEALRQETLARWEEAESGRVVGHDLVIQSLDSWGAGDKSDV